MRKELHYDQKFQKNVKQKFIVLIFHFRNLKLSKGIIKIIKTFPNFLMCGIQSDIPLLLRKLVNALKCIPPTSVESERAFSITGQFATKLRTKLDDDTLSSLVFLNAFYKNEAPN